MKGRETRVRGRKAEEAAACPAGEAKKDESLRLRHSNWKVNKDEI